MKPEEFDIVVLGSGEGSKFLVSMQLQAALWAKPYLDAGQAPNEW